MRIASVAIAADTVARRGACRSSAISPTMWPTGTVGEHHVLAVDPARDGHRARADQVDAPIFGGALLDQLLAGRERA